MQNLKILLLKNNTILVTEIHEVGGAELGEPDCKLVNPVEMSKQPFGEYTVKRWPDFTDQKEIKIHSDSILTIVDPKSDQIEQYLKAIK
jgi:hypothetical protein